MEEEWYMVYQGSRVGPMPKQALLSYGLNPQSQVWRDGMADWAPAYTIPELMELISVNNAQQANQQQMNNGYNMSPNPQIYDKSKVAAGLLAIFLGGLGIQYFYLGKVGGGFLTILLTIVTCGLWEIVTLIQGILMLTMTDEQFYQKYVASTATLPLF